MQGSANARLRGTETGWPQKHRDLSAAAAAAGGWPHPPRTAGPPPGRELHGLTNRVDGPESGFQGLDNKKC